MLVYILYSLSIVFFIVAVLLSRDSFKRISGGKKIKARVDSFKVIHGTKGFDAYIPKFEFMVDDKKLIMPSTFSVTIEPKIGQEKNIYYNANYNDILVDNFIGIYLFPLINFSLGSILLSISFIK